MKNFAKFLTIAILGLLLSASVSAQSSATQTADALAIIISPLTITADRDLNFGQIVNDADGGTVTITAADPGVRSFAAGLTNLAGLGDNPNSAQFTINGTDGLSYDFSITGMTATLADGSGNTMTVALSTSLVAGTYVFAGATQVVNFGGTLTVAGGQAAGTYSSANAGGTPIEISVNYN